jgi:hypothetical protein
MARGLTVYAWQGWRAGAHFWRGLDDRDGEWKRDPPA